MINSSVRTPNWHIRISGFFFRGGKFSAVAVMASKSIYWEMMPLFIRANICSNEGPTFRDPILEFLGGNNHLIVFQGNRWTRILEPFVRGLSPGSEIIIQFAFREDVSI